MFGRTRRIEATQRLILQTIINLGANIMASLDDITALANQNATLTGTLITAVQTEAANVASEAATITQLQAQIAAIVPADPGEQAKIDAIAATLTTTAGNLTAATTNLNAATTTAAPAADPAPDPNAPAA